MKHITQAMERLSTREDQRARHDTSIVQKIILRTNSPKTAAVLALDLLLVGVDTVSTQPHDGGGHGKYTAASRG
jgi:cytochrome P450 family 49 subfamily A